MSTFAIGDLVWAKMKGFCPWPGVISGAPPELKNQKKPPNSHYVYFFGSNNYAIIKEESIKPYQEFKGTMTKNKLNSFKHAVEEIEEYIVNPNKYRHINGTKNNIKISAKAPKLLAKKVKNKIVTKQNNKKANQLIQRVLKNSKNIPKKKEKSNNKTAADVLKNQQVCEQEEMQVVKCDDKENSLDQPPPIQLCNIRVVVERNVFQCQTCNMIFSSNNKLNIHKRIHSKKTEKKSRKPHNHVKTKITKKPKIKIRLQMKKFNFKTSVSRSVKKLPVNSKKYVCKYCERILQTESHLRAHLKLHNDGGLPCQLCGKVFPTGKSLRIHLKRHDGVKNHVCPECNKAFYERHYLTRHLRVHSDYRPFACEYCEKTFKDSQAVKRHILTHLNNKKPKEND